MSDEKDKVFYALLREDSKKDVPPAAFKLYIKLMRKAEIADWEGPVIISLRTLASDVNYSMQKLMSSIKILTDRNLIQYTPGNRNKDHTKIWFPQIPFSKEKKEDSEKINKKIKYSELVMLTEDEYSFLLQKFGEERTTKLIEDLTRYMHSTGAKYESHYHEILIFDDIQKKQKEGRKNAIDNRGADKNNEKDTGEPKYGYSDELIDRLENE